MELAELFGCSTHLIRGYRSKEKDRLEKGVHYKIEYHKSNGKYKYLWSKEGAILIARKTKKDKAKRFLAKLGVADLETSRVESQIINIITSSIQGIIEEFKVEHCVGPYRVDLYFPSLNLAIECDERGHSSYDKFWEEIREDQISEALNCKFLRFNPDDSEFNVGNVINAILREYLKKSF